MTATRTAGARVAPAEVAPHPLDVVGAFGRPARLVCVRGWQIVVGAPLRRVTDLDDLDRVAEALGWRDVTPAGTPPFTGGLVGAISDDLTAEVLGLPNDRRPGWRGRALDFGLHDTAACRAPDGTWHLVAVELADSTEPAARRLERLAERLWSVPAGADARTCAPAGTSLPAAGGAGTCTPAGTTLPAAASLSRAEHAAAVERARGWIAAGDLYQLNLTLQLSVPWAGDSLSLARRLAATEVAPAHGALLLGEDARDVVSVSPETFLRLDGDAVRMRPIKGTRPRGVDVAADAALADALRASAKDHAEHVMIVDLVRNDLGRVCRPGSVRVASLAALEGLPTVWHLTSDVVGRLRAGVRLSELLAASFPCGSVTGAPKRRAVQRIRALEPVRRGVYCGAVGVITRGLVDLSVAIRTAVVTDGIASWGTGGGIVADSTPDGEWEEAMAKAAAFLTATGSHPPT